MTGRKKEKRAGGFIPPAFEVPYAVAIIDMDEGYQMMSNVIDCAIEDVSTGMRVQVDFREVSDDLVLPYFRPTATT